MIKEYTFCIIKPDAFEKKDEIINDILNYGFNIMASKELKLTENKVVELYGEKKINKVDGLIEFMISGKCLAVILEKENACSDFRTLVNPKKYDESGTRIKKENPKDLSSRGILRRKFGIDKMKNAVHGSNNISEAKKEIEIFFSKDEMKFFQLKSVEAINCIQNKF